MMDSDEILRFIRDLDPSPSVPHGDEPALSTYAEVALFAALCEAESESTALERHIRSLERQRDSAVFAAVAGAIGIVVLFVALLARR